MHSLSDWSGKCWLYCMVFHCRAISKVQQLATNQDLEEVGQAKKNVLKKEVLEQLITKIKGRKVSKEQEDQWTEALKTDKDLVCPCKVMKTWLRLLLCSSLKSTGYKGMGHLVFQKCMGYRGTGDNLWSIPPCLSQHLDNYNWFFFMASHFENLGTHVSLACCVLRCSVACTDIRIGCKSS